jgi:alkylation response protein AidB-like acyl-CoA dehydrogenase
MDFGYAEDQQHLYDEVVRFARSELSPGSADRDQSGTFSRELWLKCGQYGLQGLPIPKELGGSGLDALSTAIVLEGLGYGSTDGGLNFSVCAHLLSCVIPIWKHGTDAQKRKYLPALCNGSLVAANAMTEAAGGSDAFAMHTIASRTSSGFRIAGSKIFCTNGPEADVALVYAATDKNKGFQGGITAFILERSSGSFSIGQQFDKMGLRSAHLGEILVNDADVGEDSVLGGVGGGGPIFNESMDWERACLAACHVGTMQRLLEDAISYANSRQSGGAPIGRFQAISHKIADMKVRLEASRLLVYRAAWQLDRARLVGLDASMAKLYASEALKSTALDAVQIMGGYGYTKDYEGERALRDAVAGTIYSGTSEIQKNIIARWLGL